MKKVILLFALSWTSLSLVAQTQDPDQQQPAIVSEKQLDSLLSEWDMENRPGIAIAIMSQGKTVYQKGFGMADVDGKIPITPQTRFQLAELSRHFTAFAILLLEQEGKLSLEDTLEKYFAENIPLGSEINLKDLLQQSHGLYGYWPLKALAGWGMEDVFTQQHAMALLRNQKELTFKPGSDFTHTDTALMLLAEVISKASGKSYADYMNDEIFTPLGMKNTLVRDTLSEPIDNLALPYGRQGDTFIESKLTHGPYGASNIYSSVEDLMIWEAHLLDPKLGSKEMITRMEQTVKNDKGRLFNTPAGKYTMGQQYIHKERGMHEVYCMGSLGGYTSSIFKFRDHDFAAVVLSNSGAPYTGYLGMQSTYLYLEELFPEPATVDYEQLKVKKLSAKKLLSYCGTFWDQSIGISREIALKNDTLKYVRSNGIESPLIPLGKDRFQLDTGFDDKIYLEFKTEDGKGSMIYTSGEAYPIYFEKYTPLSLSAEDLKKYTGEYYSEVTGTAFHMSIAEGDLQMSHPKIGTVTLNAINERIFDADQWFAACVEFQMDESGRVLAFTIGNQAVLNLSFSKITTL